MLPGELSCAGAELFVTTDTAPLHRLWSKIRELKLTRRAPRWHSAVIVTPVETFSRKKAAPVFLSGHSFAAAVSLSRAQHHLLSSGVIVTMFDWWKKHSGEFDHQFYLRLVTIKNSFWRNSWWPTQIRLQLISDHWGWTFDNWRFVDIYRFRNNTVTNISTLRRRSQSKVRKRKCRIQSFVPVAKSE